MGWSGITEERFTRLYDDQAERVLVFFTRRTFDGETALDLWSETFAQAYASRRRFRGATDEVLVSWLYGIAHNVLNRYLRQGYIQRRTLRRLGIERPETHEGEIERIEELAGLADLRGAIAAALEDLPEVQREAVRLRIVDERSYPEIAALLGTTEQAIRARVSRALRSLSHAVDRFSTHHESTDRLPARLPSQRLASQQEAHQ